MHQFSKNNLKDGKLPFFKKRIVIYCDICTFDCSCVLRIYKRKLFKLLYLCLDRKIFSIRKEEREDKWKNFAFSFTFSNLDIFLTFEIELISNNDQ